MFQIRRNCFETNSSSTHCLAVPQKSYITNIKYLNYLKGKKLRFNLGYFGRPLETIKVKPTDYLYTAILADLPLIGWQDGFSTDELTAIRENSEMPDIRKYCPKAVERLNKLKNILDKYNIEYSFEKPVWVRKNYLGYEKPQYGFAREYYDYEEGTDFGIDHPEDLDYILDKLFRDDITLINFLFKGIVMVGSDEAEDEEIARITIDKKTYTEHNWDNNSYTSEEKENPNYKEGYICYYKGN